jgi:hypothetical protein
MKYVTISALLFCSLFCSAQQTNSAPPPEATQIAHDKARAAKGDTAAMFHMALYYCYGQGMPQDFVKAKTWLQKAADKGHTPSMVQLGIMNMAGKGGKKDPVKALAFFRKAAKKGDGVAMNEIGMMYEEGDGVKKDMVEAVKNFQGAAEKGITEAMSSLAMCYIKGNGVTKDPVTASKWLQKAAEGGDMMAANDLAFFYRSPDLGNDCKKAMEWYMKARDLGDTGSLPAVGEIAMEGKCKDAEYKAVAQWMKKYADQGDGDACFFMAGFYAEAVGVEHDYVKAMNLLMTDADQLIKNHAKENDAIDELFDMYDSGNLSPSDMETLLKWLEQTADKTNDAGMMAGIGFIYTNKENATKRDYTKAMTWAMRSADKGNPTGCFNVGYLYANGLGVMQDDKKGFEWIMKAAEKGDKVAMRTIGDFYENGQGVARSHTKALEWKAKAKVGEKPEQGKNPE